MRGSRVLFSAQTGKWATPTELYSHLNDEFRFTLDPCPLDYIEGVSQDGLARSWAGERVFCNPPYGRGIARWLAKAREATVSVFLLPSRTDTAWFHDWALDADEIRFLRGRLTFGEAKHSAPFPSMVLVYRTGSQ